MRERDDELSVAERRAAGIETAAFEDVQGRPRFCSSRRHGTKSRVAGRRVILLGILIFLLIAGHCTFARAQDDDDGGEDKDGDNGVSNDTVPQQGSASDDVVTQLDNDFVDDDDLTGLIEFDFDFKASDEDSTVSDMLKNLAAQDKDGGKIETTNYDGHIAGKMGEAQCQVSSKLEVKLLQFQYDAWKVKYFYTKGRKKFLEKMLEREKQSLAECKEYREDEERFDENRKENLEEYKAQKKQEKADKKAERKAKHESKKAGKDKGDKPDSSKDGDAD